MKSLVTFERAMYSHRSSCSGRKMPKGVSVASGLKSWSAALVLVRLRPRRENGPDIHRRLGVDRDPQGVLGPIGLGVDLLQLLEDGVGLRDSFWGRHLATLVRRKPSRLSFVLIVCWVGNSASV